MRNNDRQEPGRSEPDYTVAVSPRQLAAGFAIVAAVLILLARRARNRGRRRDRES